MAFKTADFILETTTTTGTGALTLGGAVAEHKAFSTFMSNGDTTLYSVKLGTEWETGLGTYSSGTIQRTQVRQSSNSNNLVNFSAGTKQISCSPTAASAAPGRHDIPISAGACRPRLSGGASGYSNETSTNKIQVAGYSFTNGSRQAIQLSIVLPNQVDVAAGFTFVFHWTSPSASSGSVTWGAAARALSDGDTIDGALGTGVEVSDAFSSTSVHQITGSTATMTVGNSWAAGDRIVFEFYRRGDTDSLNAAAILTDIVMTAYANKGNDS